MKFHKLEIYGSKRRFSPKYTTLQYRICLLNGMNFRNHPCMFPLNNCLLCGWCRNMLAEHEITGVPENVFKDLKSSEDKSYIQKNILTISLSDTFLNMISSYFSAVRNLMGVRQNIKFVRLRISDKSDIIYVRNILIMLHNLEAKRFILNGRNIIDLEERLPAFLCCVTHDILS